MAEDALDLGVSALPHHNHLVALGVQALGRAVGALDVGAGGVNDLEASLVCKFLHGGNHTVSPEHERRARLFGNVLGNRNALGLEL